MRKPHDPHLPGAPSRSDGTRESRAARLPRADAYPSVPHDRREIARFLREQPPIEIPRRYGPPVTPGLVALPLLGYRVIRHGH